MKGFGIKQQLRLATLIPVSCVTLLFICIYNTDLHVQLEKHIYQLSEAYLHQLLPTAPPLMLNEHHQILQKFVNIAMMLISAIVALIGVSLSSLFHIFLVKRIYLPILRLRHTMKQISHGSFETPIKKNSSGELGIIEQGCFDLQQRHLDTLTEFNQHVDTATHDLQQGLEHLEEKNVQLLLDKRKAEEKLKQKSILITSLSHEIRTPMNGIIGFANLLLETSLSPLARDHVKTIKNSAKDLLSILNNILDYSKINAGKLHLDAIPLDIRNCIDDVLSLAAPNAHKKGLDLIPSTALEVPKIMVGDPLRVKQIISNLINNAIKFTEQGHVLIRTHVHKTTEQTYTLCLSVIDTGIGISPDDQSTLFHAFHQASGSISRRYGGSGLGLVICKQLAEHMQGRITLESNTNQGATFSVYLTFAKLPAYEVEKKQPKRFAHIKALCFDDNLLHLEALCHGLGHFGITCIRVEAFSQLAAAFKEHADCQLAFVNLNPNHEEPIRALLNQQTIPTVLTSTWFVQDYQALGATSFLVKPPNIQKLQDTVESLLLQTASPATNQPELDHLRASLREMRPSILIAEDNAVNRMLLNAWLGTRGSIDIVDDGEQALAMCHQKHFDAILIDLHMPNLNGLDATRLIRKHTSLNKHTPVILISADSHDLDRAYLNEQGIDRKLPKPIDEKLLLHHLLAVLQDAKIKPINWSVCVQKMSGNNTLAREFLECFVSELPKHRETMLHAMKTSHYETLEQTAHTLRGACGFCGVPKLERSLAKLEYLAQHANATDAYKELNNALDDSIRHIDAVIQAHTNLELITD